jgi:hypothetical protein
MIRVIRVQSAQNSTPGEHSVKTRKENIFTGFLLKGTLFIKLATF